MFLFKTSGRTIKSVVANQKHAFNGQPKEWVVGEPVLVSKNRADCGMSERQVQYVMHLRKIRCLRPGEADRYWPGNEGRWRYLFECYDTVRLTRPFDLQEALGLDAEPYRSVMTFKRFDRSDEKKVAEFIHRHDPEVLL